MRYLGGKHRIAKEIGAIINQHRGARPFWEPFCGALNVTAVLGDNGIASDRHAGLINLYKEIQQDRSLLDKLEALSVDERLYQEAKTWPDDDPLKAFIGFGASFGGKWFGGLARSVGRSHSAEGARGLKKRLPRCQVQHLDFLSIQPQPIAHVLYLDPPYRGTTGYKFGFDSDRFEQLAWLWSQFTDVFVSEYRFPYGQEIWNHTSKMAISGGNNGAATTAVERLFYMGPACR